MSLRQDGFGRRHAVPVTGHDAVCGVQCEGFSGSNWSAPCLKSRIHRSCLLINVCRVNAVPSFPRGEKVADRPNEGAFLEGSVLKRPPHPGPLPQFFARTPPWDTTLHQQKNRGRGGQHGIMKERFSGDQTCSPSARAEGVDVGRTNYYLYPKVAL